MANRVLFCLVFFLCCLGVGTAYAQTGKMQGKVLEKATKAPIPGVNVVVKLNGAVKGFASTDEKGFYSISPLVPGTYTVEFINLAFATVKLDNVPIEVDKTRFLNADLVEAGVDVGTVDVVHYRVPVVDQENPTQNTLDNAAIMKLPTREIGTLVASQPGVFQNDDRGALNLKGARSAGTVYFVNGVKVNGSAPNLPTSAIAALTVVTGGVPAQYGDAVGGIINITTTSPSSKYQGGIEAETSTPFDKYNNNLVNFNLSGPIVKRKAEEGKESKGALIGFFASGQYQGATDETPLYRGLYQVKADKMAEITAKPFARSSTGVVPSASLLRLSDLEKVKVRPNSASRRLSYNATIDFQPIDNILFSVGGSYDQYRQDLYQENSGLLNSDNNPRRFTTNWSGFARFTQNFPTSGDDQSIIKNAYYQIQGDFSRFDRVVQNETYKDNLAAYGYVGRFQENPLVFATGEDTTVNGVTYPVYVRSVFPGTLSFAPSGSNPVLANYSSQLLNDRDLYGQAPGSTDQLVGLGGIRNGTDPNLVQNTYFGQGQVFDQYLRQVFDQYRLSALGAADIGKHTIKAGFEFEQRVEAFYVASPLNIWSAARGLANSHIDIGNTSKLELPFGNVETVTDGVQGFVLNQTYALNGRAESNYSKLVRGRLGYGAAQNTLTINTDDILNPDNLKIQDFTADEAILQGIVGGYQGYSYTGKRAANKRVAFNDFFTDEQNRPQDAYRPTYAAAFLEDKFTIEDLILRVGVRIDRFDANQKVLKDKYALTDLQRVGGLNLSTFQNGPNYQRPSNIGDDYAIYVAQDLRNDIQYTGPQDNPNFLITGYRNGDVFYTADGIVTEDLEQLKGNSVLTQLFRGDLQGSTTPGQNLEYLRGRGLSLRAFRDYKPQINVMPRVSFSFPISEDAMFFAHYDILTQRPENNPTLPSDYYLLAGSVFGSAANQINNPDLKPQRKIDMQVGFQQRLTQASGLTLSAFYSELRDLIQYRPVFGAYPIDYITFANIDFGTVKGLTLEYDLRRTKNVAFNASYTLQFAKGTGSNSTSGFNLASQGQPNLRVPIPLDYDQRNQVKASVDFRFADGEGPLAFGTRFLQNAGVNFLIQGGSGTPYSRQQEATQAVSIGVQQRSALAGALNGSRLPANARIALRIDKDFSLKFGDKAPFIKNLNVYVRAQNLLNSANVLNVFRYTGSADDDGFLASPIGPGQAGFGNATALSQADLYTAKLFGTNNFSLPRRIFLGAMLSF